MRMRSRLIMPFKAVEIWREVRFCLNSSLREILKILDAQCPVDKMLFAFCCCSTFFNAFFGA